MSTEPSQDQINALVNLYHSGQMVIAERVCRELLQANPQSLIVLNILGAALQEQGESEAAVTSYNKAIQLNPDYAEAYFNRGNAHQKLGQLEAVVESYDKAIELRPDYVDAHMNRGNALRDLGRFEEAVASYDKTIDLKPDYVEAYYNRGNSLRDLGRSEEALENYDKAIQLKPDYALAYYNRGNTFLALGLLDEAGEAYDKVIQLKPDFAAAYSGRVFALNYSPKITQSELYTKHLEFGKQFGGPGNQDSKATVSSRDVNTRLRVGYISPDFRLHSVAYFFEPLLKSHDKRSIEVYCYYNNAFEDEITKRLMREAEHWRSISLMNDQNVVDLIRNDNIDILVDLVGHTAMNRLMVFTHKPAPIQVTWLGYPNTTGLSLMDYRLTDAVADPVGEADEQHSEKLVRLENGFLCYLGENSSFSNGALPCLDRGYVTFGSFNTLAKVTPQVVKLWARILLAVPNAHLLLKSEALVDGTAKSRYLNMFKQEGVSIDRVELYSRLPKKEDHLALYDSVDIALDPFPYNGTTTTCEALWMGVPVITAIGDRHAARVGASILTHAGLEGFIAKNLDEYFHLAVRYASNTEYLAELRRELRNKMRKSTLCDAELFARGVENAYQKMWEEASSSLPGLFCHPDEQVYF